jgi:hypothetical protein
LNVLVLTDGFIIHAIQEGEEGYIPETPAPEMKSSREQLVIPTDGVTECLDP